MAMQPWAIFKSNDENRSILIEIKSYLSDWRHVTDARVYSHNNQKKIWAGLLKQAPENVPERLSHSHFALLNQRKMTSICR